MKLFYTIALAWLAYLPMSLSAQVSVVREVAQSTSTVVHTVSISSGNPGPAIARVDVAAESSTGTVSGYWAIEVYNLAANTVTLNCGFDVCLSTTSSSACYGREVPPGVGVLWQVADRP